MRVPVDLGDDDAVRVGFFYNVISFYEEGLFFEDIVRRRERGQALPSRTFFI